MGLVATCFTEKKKEKKKKETHTHTHTHKTWLWLGHGTNGLCEIYRKSCLTNLTQGKNSPYLLMGFSTMDRDSQAELGCSAPRLALLLPNSTSSSYTHTHTHLSIQCSALILRAGKCAKERDTQLTSFPLSKASESTVVFCC